MSVSIDSLKKAYVISGEDDGNGGPAQGMLVYDFEEESWTHQSTPWSDWASGLAVHVPDPIDGPGYILAFAGRSTAVSYDLLSIANQEMYYVIKSFQFLMTPRTIE